MKLRKKLPGPKPLLAYLLLLILFCVLTVGLHACSKSRQQRAFEALSQEYYLEYLSSSTLALHHHFAHPPKELASLTPQLPSLVNDDSYSQRLQELEHTLRSIQPRYLSKENQTALILLTDQVSTALKLSRLPALEDPLSPTNSLPSNLLLLLSQYSFYTQKDVEDYLTLLGQLPDYFQSLMDLEWSRAEEGLILSKSSLLRSMEQCQIPVGELLSDSFRQRLSELSRTEPLSSAQQSQYIRDHAKLLQNQVEPAFQELSEEIRALGELSPYEEPMGLARFPKGLSYYQLLVYQETGSRRSLQELSAMLQRRLLWLREELQGLPATAFTEVVEPPYSTPGAMLQGLYQSMQGQFPPCQEPEYLGPIQLHTISPAMESLTAPAFYLLSPIDLSNHKVFFQGKSLQQPLELYTTLAHEAFPGHLYQHSYWAAYMAHSRENQVRSVLWYGGYLEGWGLYSELTAYERLKEVCPQRLWGSLDLERLLKELELCLYCICDLQIHGSGAGLKEIETLLGSAYDLEANPQAGLELYRYIADSPANYLKYYVGYLEILELKKSAQEQLGDSYTDSIFHGFLLNQGPAPFWYLESSLKEYLAAYL